MHTVAKVSGTSVAMIEKYYGKLAIDYPMVGDASSMATSFPSGSPRVAHVRPPPQRQLVHMRQESGNR